MAFHLEDGGALHFGVQQYIMARIMVSDRVGQSAPSHLLDSQNLATVVGDDLLDLLSCRL